MGGQLNNTAAPQVGYAHAQVSTQGQRRQLTSCMVNWESVSVCVCVCVCALQLSFRCSCPRLSRVNLAHNPSVLCFPFVCFAGLALCASRGTCAHQCVQVDTHSTLMPLRRGAVRGPMFLFILGCSRFMSPLGASELSRKLAYFMLCAYLCIRIFIYIFEFREWTENPNRNL